MTRRFVAPLLLALAAFAALAALVGAWAGGAAGARLVGAADVELTYEAAAEPEPAGFGEDLRALVLRRFAAAQVGADVLEEGRRLRVIVDESLASQVDELVTWPGTLLVMEPDLAYPLVPREGHGLTPKSVALADGSVDRFWEGPRVLVLHAAEAWSVDRDHRLVAEPQWETAHVTDEVRWRTRVVHSAPIGELGEGILVGRGEGGTLRLRAQRGTVAERVIHDARVRERSPTGAERSSPPVLVRGRTSIGTPRMTDDAVILAFGAGLRAYERAQEERLLLTTPLLPPLRRVGVVGLPPNTTLAAACFVVPLVLSLAWLAFVRRFDRAHPEPVWLVLFTFVLGAVASVPAGFAELLLSRASPWLDPRVATFGGQVFALPLAFVVFTVVVGFVEEGAKLLGASFARRRPEFDEPIDGIVYGVASSLGFAAAENFHYFASSRLAATTVLARCFMSVPAHMFFGAIWGYALGARLVDKRIRVVLFLGVAAACHGLFDALLSTDGAGLFAVLLEVGLASVFVKLVQRALRHGIVEHASLAVRAEERLSFRVGRPVAFAISSIALHALAFGVFLLGAWFQLARHRPGLPFVLGSSVMLALLALAAFGVSAALPLDVLIDDYGVTFAGAARPWRRIRRFSVEGSHVVLECDAGPIRLGPAAPDMLDAIAQALGPHLGAARLTTLDSG